MPRPKGSKNKTPASIWTAARLAPDVREWLVKSGDIAGSIEKLVRQEIEKQKQNPGN